MTWGSAERNRGPNWLANTADEKPENSTSCVKVVTSPFVVKNRVILSLARGNAVSNAYCLPGSKLTTLKLELGPLSGVIFPSTSIAKGAAADASLSSVSQVGQRGTSIHMAQTRCGGAFTLTLWRNSALVPWAIACWVEVSGVVAVVEFMVGEVVLDVHAVSEANVTALAKKQ